MFWRKFLLFSDIQRLEIEEPTLEPNSDVSKYILKLNTSFENAVGLKCKNYYTIGNKGDSFSRSNV